MPKLGLIHYNLPQFSFVEFLDYVQEGGFDCVELAPGDVWDESNADDNPEANAEKVRGQFEQRGIEVSALSAGNDFVLLDEAAIEPQVARMRRICGLAKILGTNVIRTEGGAAKPQVPEDRHVEAMAGCLKRCIEFIEPDDIYLAVDNHGMVTNDADLQVDLFGRVGSRHVGANLDTMNYRWAGHTLEEIHRYYEIIAPHVCHTHVKDGFGSLENYQGKACGEGEIELAHAVSCLKKAGYQGAYCAEYEGKDEPQPEGYRKCLAWMRANIR